jgi:Holliday junction resolvase
MLDSQAGRSVLANTSYTLLLRQKPAMIKSVQNVFHLSEAEKVLLLTARPGEGLLLMENEHSEINITASKKEHEIITTNADELLVQREETIVSKKKENKIRDGQKAYLKRELDKAELSFLITSGFKEIKEKSISGKDEVYLVVEDKNESPSHIICIKEIVDYLKQFTQDIQTYRSVKPDIVFNANGKKFAIEVETGKINNLKQLKEKVENLKKYYGDNWCFFVTNRDLSKYYSKFGKLMNKRTVKTKIDKIFKNSEK